MSNTLKLGNGNWATKKDSLLAYNDENNNFKPLPFNFTRNSSATRVNKEGLIEVVSNNEPRIDFLNDSKGALKLEPSRSNTITYSNDFLDSSWNVFRGSVTADVIISPDGTQNASRYEEDSQTGGHLFRRQNLAIQNELSYTGSIFIKKGELTSIILTSNSSARWVASATFDIENGIVTSGTGVIEDYGNGWYRCSISGNAVETTTVAGLEMLTSVGAGRDGDGLYMYGAMFEQGSYATSYIPTSGGVVTRVAEECFNLPPTGIIGQTELTIFYQGIVERLGGSDGHALALSQSADASGSSRILLYRNSGNGNMYVYVQDSTTQFSTPLLVNSNPQINDKYAIAIKNNDLVIYCNGVKVAENTSGSVPISQYVYLNKWNNQINEKNIINDFKLYDTRLSNAELQALTS